MIFKRLKKSTDEEEEKFSRMLHEEKVGCADSFAMIVSAFFVLILPCLGVLLALAGLILWLLGAF